MDEDMNSRTQGFPAEHCIVMRRPMFHLLVLSLLWLITFVFQAVSWVLFHSISSRFIVFNSNTQIGSTCKWDRKNWNWIISPAQNYHTGCVCDWGVISLTALWSQVLSYTTCRGCLGLHSHFCHRMCHGCPSHYIYVRILNLPLHNTLSDVKTEAEPGSGQVIILCGNKITNFLKIYTFHF